MKHSWSWRSTQPDCYALVYGPDVVGEVWWIRTLRHGPLTMDRIVEGLNGGADGAPPRTWTVGTEGSPGRFDLRHNGVTVGEVGWLRRPTHVEMWNQRIVDGMNRPSRGDADPYPEPLPPRPLEQRELTVGTKAVA